jgi:hypothetical protein
MNKHPSTKLQPPEKFHVPNFKRVSASSFWSLIFGASLEVGVGDLEL